MSIITTTFEGVQLSTITHNGRRVWIAGQVGDALEYSHGGHRLVRNISTRWSDEVRLGEHYDVLSGTDLRDSAGTEVVPAKSRSAMVLYEEGLNLVLLLTKDAVGVTVTCSSSAISTTLATNSPPPSTPVTTAPVLSGRSCSLPPPARCTPAHRRDRGRSGGP